MSGVHKDFHGAISCAFQFLDERYGIDVLDEFLEQVGKNCYRELIFKINQDGLLAIEEYWNRIFTLEDGEFKIDRDEDSITLELKRCPAISHLLEVGYPVYRDFCRQTRMINSIIAKETGLEYTVESQQNKACCIQKFWRRK
ncbi:MAG: hypothetical protein KBI34_06735 [Dictyoglomi bacterium]|nr:hypothetical protein [Dictyoglomota bacterium]HHV81700.1 hypothetical protein [bacterium]